MRFPLLLIALTTTLIFPSNVLHAKGSTKNKKAKAPADSVLDTSGVDFDLGNSLTVNVRVVKNRFELYFLDEERVPLDLKYQKARIVFEPTRARKQSANKVIMTLSPAKEKKVSLLRANKVVRPPHSGKILVTLLHDGANKPLGTAQLRPSPDEDSDASSKK